MNAKILLIQLVMIAIGFSISGCDSQPGPANHQSNSNNNHSDESENRQDQSVPELEADSKHVAWEWQFDSELSHNYYYEETDEVLLIYGHDGLLSGHHMDEALYAVDKHTGQLRWQIDAGYRGFDLTISEDGQLATILVRDEEHTLRHLNIVADGSDRWSQHDVDGDSMLALGQTIIIYDRSLPPDEQSTTMTAYNVHNGEQTWIRTIEAPYVIPSSEATDPYIMVLQAGQLIALDPDTGEEIWTAKMTEQQPSMPMFLTLSPNEEPFQQRWLNLRDHGLVYIDVSTGSILSRYNSEPGEIAIFAINERYWIIDRDKLYDTFEQREVYTFPGEVTEPLLEGDVLYAMVDGVPAAINWTDGSLIWKLDMQAKDSPVELTYAGNFSILDESYIALPYGEELIILEKTTGNIVYRVDDFAFDYPLSLAPYSRDGLINISDEWLYIGSANGHFSSVKLKTFLDAIP